MNNQLHVIKYLFLYINHKAWQRIPEGVGRTSLAVPDFSGVVGSSIIGGGVASGDGVVFGVIARVIVLGEVAHADALPHGVHHDSDSEEHDLGGVRGGGGGGERHFPVSVGRKGKVNCGVGEGNV